MTERNPVINYSARKVDGTYRDLTVLEWKTVRQLSHSGKTILEVAEALGNQFSPEVIRKRGAARGLTFSRKSAHLGTSNLSLGGKYDEKKFEREHPAILAEQADR